MSKNNQPAITTGNEINIDEILAKRQEVTGHANKFPFQALGRQWLCYAPDLSDDDFKQELQDLSDAMEERTIATKDWQAEFAYLWLGEEQGAEFLEAAAKAEISSNWILQTALGKYNEQVAANPTRPSYSKNRAQRRQR